MPIENHDIFLEDNISMKTIFKNNQRIEKSDIAVQIGRGVLLIVGFYIVSNISFSNREPDFDSTTILIIFIVLILTYTILFAKTTERIEIDESNNKLILTTSRQLRTNKITHLKLSEIGLKLKTIPSRSFDKEKVLIISDKKNKIKLSTKHKGITEAELNKIHDKIEKATHNNGYI
ncbi:hypothetical protein M601_005000 [Cellulophaga baltica 4]|nr:hypothetical protein M601_005000 [Cellulophaga baltica 4]